MADGLSPQNRGVIKRLRAKFIVLEKVLTRFARQKPAKRTRRAINGERPRSGLELPRPISDGLCCFMHLDPGSEVSRADVTRFISSYIKEHELQDPIIRTQIIPDDKIQKLFNIGPEEVVTFPGVQKLLKICDHFLPTVVL